MRADEWIYALCSGPSVLPGINLELYCNSQKRDYLQAATSFLLSL